MSSHALLLRITVPLMIAGLCALPAGLRVAAAATDPNIIPQQMTVTQIEAAQRVPNLRAIHVDKSGIPSHIHGDLGSFRTEVSTPEAETAAFVGRMRNLLRADGSETFKLRRLTREAGRGAQHYRMKQLINGLEVIGGEVIVHVDQTTSRIVSIDAQFLPGTGLPRKPAIDGNTAIAGATAEEIKGSNVEQLSEPRLAYARSPEATGHLVWAARVRYIDSQGRRQVDDLLVDALTGRFVRRLPRVHPARDREVIDARDGRILLRELGITNDAAALRVHENSGAMYDFLFQSYGRDSWDGAGGTWRSYIHSPGIFDVASFHLDEGAAYFGDVGGVSFGNARDVVAHEFAHGMTDKESELVYAGESGALNEAISDIFGAAVEAWATGGVSANTWLGAEDVATPPVRYMNDPVRDGRSRDFYPNLQPGDDVHYGSGIGNLAFFLISQGGVHPRGKTWFSVNGIGIERATRIVYLALVRHLQFDSRYTDMAFAMARVSQEEFGVSSPENWSVCLAWGAVGVPSGSLYCPPERPPAPSVVHADGGVCPDVEISWSFVSGATFYRLHQSLHPIDSNGATIVYQGPNNWALHYHEPLISRRTWYYKVEACYPWGCGAISTAQGSRRCPLTQ